MIKLSKKEYVLVRIYQEVDCTPSRKKKEMLVKLVNSKSIIDCDENEDVYNQL